MWERNQTFLILFVESGVVSLWWLFTLLDLHIYTPTHYSENKLSILGWVIKQIEIENNYIILLFKHCVYTLLMLWSILMLEIDLSGKVVNDYLWTACTYCYVRTIS